MYSTMSLFPHTVCLFILFADYDKTVVLYVPTICGSVSDKLASYSYFESEGCSTVCFTFTFSHLADAFIQSELQIKKVTKAIS